MNSLEILMLYQKDLTDNHRIGIARGGRKFLKAHVRAWQDELCLKARNRIRLDNLTLTPPLKIVVRYFLPIGNTLDVGNLHKSIGDGLKAGLEIDDRYFRYEDEHVEYVAKDEARFVIRVEESE
jgi:hypothetical protein